MNRTITAAVVQTSPVLFNKDATIEKVGKKMAEVSGEKPDLVLFPEAFVPAYPRGLSFGAPVGGRTEEGRALFQIYWDNSIAIPGPETEKLGKFAKETGCYLCIGVIEKEMVGTSSLYCTLLYFNPEGQLLGKHRKLKPTAAERVIWAEGDGSTLSSFETSFGVLGGLICWENYMPLARMSMYEQGAEVYLAPTADQRDSWQATMQHIACEGRCFVLGCNQYVEKSDYPEDLPGISDLEGRPEIICRGGSVIVDPFGKNLAGPLYDEEGILLAALDKDLLTRAKMDFDPIGHYNRRDVFSFEAKEQPPRKKG